MKNGSSTYRLLALGGFVFVNVNGFGACLLLPFPIGGVKGAGVVGVLGTRNWGGSWDFWSDVMEKGTEL